MNALHDRAPEVAPAVACVASQAAEPAIVEIQVETLAEHCNPLQAPGPWDTPVALGDVQEALRTNRLVSTPDTDDHAGRIAYLVRHKASDPISVDVGCPVLEYWGPDWIVTDGNHRLAAALYRGDTVISAQVTGEVEWACELLGIDPKQWPGLE